MKYIFDFRRTIDDFKMFESYVATISVIQFIRSRSGDRQTIGDKILTLRAHEIPILTASNFVAAVQAIALHVAVVALRDTLFIGAAGELVVTARRSRGGRRAVLLVAVVRAILVAVATPQLADALLIIATELVGLASVRTCRDGRTKTLA